MSGTVTVSWDGKYPFARRPGWHVNRQGKRVRSARAWWLWFAVAWYRMDDYELVARPHEWSEGPGPCRLPSRLRSPSGCPGMRRT
jgi:hypothetical protein